MQVLFLTWSLIFCVTWGQVTYFDDIVVELGGKDLPGSKLTCSIFRHLRSVSGKIAPTEVGQPCWQIRL